MASKTFTPERIFQLHEGLKPPTENNIELINELTADGRFEAAGVVAQVEIIRQLDRIATALEAKSS